MRRVKWPNAWMLADELWLILSSLEPPTTGKITMNDTLADDDTYTLPALKDLNIPPLDLEMPNAGTRQPVNDQDDLGDQLQNEVEECFWHRAVAIGEITGMGETSTQFLLTAYPNGELGNSCVNKWREDPEVPFTNEGVVATCLGDPDAVEVGDWVMLVRFSQWMKKTVTLRDKRTMAIIDTETELTLLQEAFYFVAPSGGGGGTVAMTTSEISALSGTTPGSGMMQRYRLEGGTLVALGSPVQVYSSVRVAVESGKWIQAKKIAGRDAEGQTTSNWWVDVEDCKDESEGI
jgi:hypothetical protein